MWHHANGPHPNWWWQSQGLIKPSKLQTTLMIWSSITTSAISLLNNSAQLIKIMFCMGTLTTLFGLMQWLKHTILKGQWKIKNKRMTPFNTSTSPALTLRHPIGALSQLVIVSLITCIMAERSLMTCLLNIPHLLAERIACCETLVLLI